ncbi:MAG: glycosyl transferase family 2 [Arcobacter sp.]|mgnify:CR=1 FL=1|nr:glycosyl transferase family 2 [Arcobacter sp.]|tara:strand:- start:13318 stop:14292 length:975 start_codon:yes stop_codon:yes gene_type:complete
MPDKTEQEIIKNWKGNLSNPKVSICCITFMHENYISQALDSFLMQETSFPFEIIVRDDGSSDKTAEIIRQYQKKYSKIIKPILEPENTYSKGIRATPAVFKKAIGEYIALCEGDDYWTDKDKLQIQVNFLDNNKEYNGSFHDSLNMYDDESKNDLRIGNRDIDEDVDTASLIYENNIATASLIFRNNLGELPKYYQETKKGDYAVAVRVSEFGKLKYIPRAMSIYRIHEGGIWSLKKQEFHELEAIKFYNLLYIYFKNNNLRKVITIKINFSYYRQSINYIRNEQIIFSIKNIIKSISIFERKHKSLSYKKYLKELIKYLIKRK